MQRYNFFLIYARKIWIFAKKVVLLQRIMAKIGIFDSGYGGLTILEAIRRELPQYDYLYLGDNARAPYGTHSFDVIYRYTLQAVKYLFSQDCALVILACNTASAKALRTIQQKDLPLINDPYGEADRSNEGRLEMVNDQMVNVLGVIRPTVEAVPSITKTGHVGILATPATVSSESYVLELEKIAKLPNDQINDQMVNDQMVNAQPFTVVQQACPLWVPLIENGEHLNPGADYFVDKYLQQILEAEDQSMDSQQRQTLCGKRYSGHFAGVPGSKEPGRLSGSSSGIRVAALARR